MRFKIKNITLKDYEDFLEKIKELKIFILSDEDDLIVDVHNENVLSKPEDNVSYLVKKLIENIKEQYSYTNDIVKIKDKLENIKFCGINLHIKDMEFSIKNSKFKLIVKCVIYDKYEVERLTEKLKIESFIAYDFLNENIMKKRL